MKKIWFILLILVVLCAGCVKEDLVVVPPTSPPFIIDATPEPTPTPPPHAVHTVVLFNSPDPTSTPKPILTRENGSVEGPSGKETYYNLPMDGVVGIMRDLGYNEEEYPYWERADGCKMLGEYIMCAANLDIRPRGTILESSLGTCIVCDTGEFVN